MNKPGRIFKQYGCRDGAGQRLGKKRPRLAERTHGSWYFHSSATSMLGRPERARRGRYPSKAAACRARHSWLTQSRPTGMAEPGSN